MKNILLLLFFLISTGGFSQKAKVVMDLNNNPITWPSPLIANSSDLVVATGPSRAESSNLIHIKQDGAKSLISTSGFESPWHIYYPQKDMGTASLEQTFLSHGSKAYFIVESYEDPEQKRLIEYDFITRDMHAITEGYFVNNMQLLNNKIYLPFTDRTGAPDSTFVVYDIESATLSSLSNPRFRGWAMGYTFFKDDLISTQFKDASYAYAGIGRLNIEGNEGITLTPAGLPDTIKNGAYAVTTQMAVTDSVIYFDLKYFSADYHEYSLWSSKGNEGDAKKIAILHTEQFQGGGGLNISISDKLMPNDLEQHNGLLYFFSNQAGSSQLHRTDGTTGGTVKISDRYLNTSVGWPYNVYDILDGNLYMLAQHSDNPAFSALYKLDLNNLSETVLVDSIKLLNAMKALNDSLLLLFSTEDNMHYDFLLFNLQSGHLEKFHTNRTINYDAIFWPALIGRTLYFSGDSDNKDVLMSYDLDGPSGLKEESDLAWEVFPNPSDRAFRLWTGNEMKTYNLTIRDINGRIIMGLKNRLQDKVDIDGLSPGLYTISLADENGKVLGCKKLVVK